MTRQYPQDPGTLRAELEAVVRHLERIDRPSASAGEREAAEWIATRLRELGHEARVEDETAHGGYWWPLGLLNGAALAGAALHARGRRRTGRLAAAVAAVAIVDDLDHRTRLFRRLCLRRRPTANVVATAGDPDASRTVVVVAHHDAAHGGAVFDTSAMAALKRRAPGLYARLNRWPPIMWLVLGGPLLIAAGARRAGALFSAGTIAAMVDIGRRPAVPGANDNLSSVAALLALGRALAERPTPGLRVLLVSTGCEESNSEGMQAFGRRHFPSLPRDSTTVIALECLGSGAVCTAESEGFLVPHRYDAGLKDLVSECGAALGVPVRRGLHVSFASDGQIALHGGYRSVLLGGIDELKLPANYHQPWDVADNLDFGALADSVRILEAMVRRIAADGAQDDASRAASASASSRVPTSPA